MTTDKDIVAEISQLADEEKKLRLRGGELGDDERGRLRSLEERLDQCWDLLRQRRAREEYDEDPDAAQPRPVDEVEHYLQ
ncbi:MAG: DUF2630 family protein [Mycobacteriales bacterium]